MDHPSPTFRWRKVAGKNPNPGTTSLQLSLKKIQTNCQFTWGKTWKICEKAIILLLSHFSNSAFSSRSRFNSCSKTSVLAANFFGSRICSCFRVVRSKQSKRSKHPNFIICPETRGFPFPFLQKATFIIGPNKTMFQRQIFRSWQPMIGPSWPKLGIFLWCFLHEAWNPGWLMRGFLWNW